MTLASLIDHFPTYFLLGLPCSEETAAESPVPVSITTTELALSGRIGLI
jgi:hypothetical protein